MTMKFCIHGHQEATCPHCAKNSNPLYKCPDCGWQGTMREALVVGDMGRLQCPNYSQASHLKPLIEMETVFPILPKKLKMLFVDDRKKRIHYALDNFSDKYEVTIAPCVPEALREMSAQDWDVISLDHDLNGHDFQDPDTPSCGMEIVRYIAKTGWPPQRKKPEFWIHSSNLFAAHLMTVSLTEIGMDAWYKPTWKKYQSCAIAGAFDIIHPGYIELFEMAEKLCHKITVLLHDKPNQILSVSERAATLKGLRYIDEVVVYRTEEELTTILVTSGFDVRILGDDHSETTSRPDLSFPTIYNKRNTGWSAIKLKTKICEKQYE